MVWTAAFGWGVSILGTFLPWSILELLLQGLGKSSASLDDPMLRYWLRMATGGWTVIGFLYLCCALRPEKYAALLPLLAIGTIFTGVVLLVNGLLLSLPPFPFWGDAAFCLFIGAGILFLSRRSSPRP